jgi:hypothetical protein
MINCRNCVNWIDESLAQIEEDAGEAPHVFMGCRIFGFLSSGTVLESCPHYSQCENLFTECHSCRKTVPRVCRSLGECVNCTDTDLYCVDHCIGGDLRRNCEHFVRLCKEGVHLIDQDRLFDLFPAMGMPDNRKDGKEVQTSSGEAPDETSGHGTAQSKY